MHTHYSKGGAPAPLHHWQRSPSRRDLDSTSLVDDFLDFLNRCGHGLGRYWRERGRRNAAHTVRQSLNQLKRDLSPVRIFSLPHLLVVFWVFMLLWGEKWVFRRKVEKCRWTNWEQWPAGAQPHHLIFIADPQLIDPHTYPGRPWPLNPLTIMVTDNYLRRSYHQLQHQLHPDTLMFLGDLFDGGREWKSAHGDFRDASWASPYPSNEQNHVKSWRRKYGADFWMREYERFGDIFFDPWNAAGQDPGTGQRGRKLIASLPGNHDLGFGAQVKIPVRDRFEAFFGDVNRVDVIGNHTLVSVDTVSLSADTSDADSKHDLQFIYKPTELFLNDVRSTKRKAVEKELRFQRGEVEEIRFKHKIDDLDKPAKYDQEMLDPTQANADLPTILLTHVPLYRAPGTPCGPFREHWPPTKPSDGGSGPVIPDHRNAISISKGYQYQNALSPEDSANLIQKVGNVVHAFSGDDHDYCEIVHDIHDRDFPEITVKSMSMAMGVPTPGFLMVSLYNPVDRFGKSLISNGKSTLQTHLCLLPKSGTIFSSYAMFGVFCVVILSARAVLASILHLSRFAPDPVLSDNASILPISKAKIEDAEDHDQSSPTMIAGYSASRRVHSGTVGTRDRNNSLLSNSRANGNGYGASSAQLTSGKSRAKRNSRDHGKWGWGSYREPRIEIRVDDDDLYRGTKWRAASSLRSGRSRLRQVLRELWATGFRVGWMTIGFWIWLARTG